MVFNLNFYFSLFMLSEEWRYVYFIALRKMRHIEILHNRINHIILPILQTPNFDNFTLTSSLLYGEDWSVSAQKTIPVDLSLCVGQQ